MCRHYLSKKDLSCAYVMPLTNCPAMQNKISMI